MWSKLTVVVDHSICKPSQRCTPWTMLYVHHISLNQKVKKYLAQPLVPLGSHSRWNSFSLLWSNSTSCHQFSRKVQTWTCQSLSHVQLFVTPGTVAHETFLSMGFSRQEYCSGFPCPSPGDLPDPGMEPRLLHCRWILHHLSRLGSPPAFWHFINSAFHLFTYLTAALWMRPRGRLWGAKVSKTGEVPACWSLLWQERWTVTPSSHPLLPPSQSWIL